MRDVVRPDCQREWLTGDCRTACEIELEMQCLMTEELVVASATMLTVKIDRGLARSGVTDLTISSLLHLSIAPTGQKNQETLDTFKC